MRDGSLNRADLSILVLPIRREVKALLETGVLIDPPTTRKTCANILKLEPASWSFVDHAGIELTNNAAERPLRRGVLWRKHCFGTQSEQGSLFVERILTAVYRLRKQAQFVPDRSIVGLSEDAQVTVALLARVPPQVVDHAIVSSTILRPLAGSGLSTRGLLKACQRWFIELFKNNDWWNE